MNNNRPYCLSIAGIDPSAGAGLLSDIKTFECLKVYGLGVTTATTIQNDDEFIGVNWCGSKEIEQQLVCLSRYSVKAIKIGLIKNLEHLELVVKKTKLLFPDAYIVWDPILKASAGYTIHEKIDIKQDLLNILDLITPNSMEFKSLDLKEKNILSSILLKGGHSETEKGVDHLFVSGNKHTITGEAYTKDYEKHGSGCVLSAAITVYLAMGFSLLDSCIQGKRYVESFLKSNQTKLGYHS